MRRFMYRVTKANRLLFTAARLLLRRPLVWCFRIRHEDHGIRRLRPPFLVVGNHAQWWDPLILLSQLCHPVHFVATDEQFRTPIMRLIHRAFGTIPSKNRVADPATAGVIRQKVADGGIVAIYPEGERTWDGKTMPPAASTAELIKLLRIPVAVSVSKGSYLSFPRWARLMRRGRVEVEHRVLFEPEEIQRLKIAELHDRLSAALAYNEYSDFQEHRMISYRGRKLAERLELFLFTCASCRSQGELRSSGNNLVCRRCGFGVTYTPRGYLRPLSSTRARFAPAVFATPHEWDAWQFKQLSRHVVESLDARREPIIQDDPAYLSVSAGKPKLRPAGCGTLSLRRSGIEFLSSNGDTLVFPIKRIHGDKVRFGDRIEFGVSGILYRFSFGDRSTSAYRWLCAIRVLRDAVSTQGQPAPRRG